MGSKPEPASYGTLASDAYRALVTAAESVNAETITFARALFGATLGAIDANNRHAAALARDLAGIVSSAHETYIATLRGIAETGISNIDFAKNAAKPEDTYTLPFPSVN
jgi:hypothetical protein